LNRIWACKFQQQMKVIYSFTTPIKMTQLLQLQIAKETMMEFYIMRYC
jgi:hypothetical protein